MRVDLFAVLVHEGIGHDGHEVWGTKYGARSMGHEVLGHEVWGTKYGARSMGHEVWGTK
jgi:hypothetical protein